MGSTKGEGDQVRIQVEVTGWSFIISFLSITHRKDIEFL